MIRSAKRGLPMVVTADALVSDLGLIAINVGGSAWSEWAAYYGRIGISLPTPSRCPVVFLPGALPPAVTRS